MHFQRVCIFCIVFLIIVILLWRRKDVVCLRSKCTGWECNRVITDVPFLTKDECYKLIKDADAKFNIPVNDGEAYRWKDTVDGEYEYQIDYTFEEFKNIVGKKADNIFKIPYLLGISKKYKFYLDNEHTNKKIEEKYCEIVKDSCLNFSIDAATPETYLKIRRLNFYDTIKRNITRYANDRPESHVISICHNINIHNLHEMPLMVKDAIEMGADSIYMNPVHSAGGYINVEKLQVTDRGLFNDLRSQSIEMAHGKIEISVIRDLPDPVLVELS